MLRYKKAYFLFYFFYSNLILLSQTTDFSVCPIRKFMLLNPIYLQAGVFKGGGLLTHRSEGSLFWKKNDWKKWISFNGIRPFLRMCRLS